MPERILLTSAQVAARLGHKASWFLRRRPSLEADHGFPRPVDGCGMRWDPAAIERWLDARLPAGAADDLALAEAELIRRAQGAQAA